MNLLTFYQNGRMKIQQNHQRNNIKLWYGSDLQELLDDFDYLYKIALDISKKLSETQMFSDNEMEEESNYLDSQYNDIIQRMNDMLCI